MRKIIVTTFVTLDGVMQAPGAPEEDPTHGFKWGGWSAKHWDKVMEETMAASMSRPFDLLLGRRTYEIFAAYWAFVKNNPIAEKFNSIHKFVVSGKPVELSWGPATLITGDALAGLRQVKKTEGPDLLVNGSSRLVQTLLESGFADTLHVWTFPVTIGKGKRLFAEGTRPADWNLVDTKVSTTGVIMASYQPKGDISVGTMVTEEPSELELKRRKELSKEE